MTPHNPTLSRRHNCAASRALPPWGIRWFFAAGFALLLLIQLPTRAEDKPVRRQGAKTPVAKTQKRRKSIEERTKIHRLSTTKRAAYDAFVYLNRIPEKAGKGESPTDLAGRIFGRLANQEGRILLKLPGGMNREAYLGYKTFLRYEGKTSVGNCAACHAPAEFTDLKLHVVTKGGSAKPTPSLRNLKKRKVDLRKALLRKIAASRQRRSGNANEIDKSYAAINISKQDIPRLAAFLKLLNDVSDKDFRNLILKAKLLDTSKDIE